MESKIFKKINLDYLIQVSLFTIILSLPFLGYSWINDTFGLSLNYLLMIFFVGLVLIKIITSHNYSFLKDRLIQILLLFFFVAVVSMFMSYKAPMREIAGEILYVKSLKHIIFLGLVISFVSVLTIVVKEKPSLIKNILKFFVVSGFITSLYGLYQFLGYYLNLPGIWYFVGSQGPGRKTFGFLWLDILRIQSFTPEPSLLANLLLPIFFILFIFILNHKEIFSKRVDLIIFFVISFNLLFTISRGMYIVAIIVLPFISLSLYKNPEKKEFIRSLSALVFISLISFAFLFAFPQTRYELRSFRIVEIVDKISSSQDISFSVRSNSIITGWSIFKDNPILGVGIGNFGFFYDRYKPVGVRGTDSPFPVSHSFFSNILAEMGILGTGVFFSFVIYLLYRAWKVFSSSKSQFEKTLLLSLSLAFLAVLLHLGISISTYSFSHFWFIVGFLISVILVLDKEEKIGKGKTINNNR